MATSKAVIQCYTAVAAVDSKGQIIVAAQAPGSGNEQSVLLPMVKSTAGMRTDQTLVTADACYHSEVNLKELYELGVLALIADGLMRRRDERNGWTASRCERGQRSMRSGTCTAWFTTSRSWRIMDTADKGKDEPGIAAP